MKKLLTFYLLLITSIVYAQNNFLAVENSSGLLRLLDGATYNTIESLDMHLNGYDINNVTGTAQIPGSDSFYAIMDLSVPVQLKSSSSNFGETKHTTHTRRSDTVFGGTGRYLVRVNPKGGLVTIIGLTGEDIASLSMHPNGTLYGVSGDGSSTSETLYTINTNDGSLTFVMSLGIGNDGEAIGFRPDGTLFHASGHNDTCANGEVCFESVDVVGLTTTNIDIDSTALVDEETQELLWSSNDNAFLWKQNHGAGPLFLVSADATSVTQVANLDFQLKGLSFTSLTSIIPPIPSLSNLALLLLIFGLLIVSFTSNKQKT